MKRNFTSPHIVLAGILLVSAVGCITGTNTFSNIGVPSTQYCRNDVPEPVFDIPLTNVAGITLSNGDTPAEVEQTVSLKP